MELLGRWTFERLEPAPDGRFIAEDVTGNGADAELRTSGAPPPGGASGALHLDENASAVIQPGPDLTMFTTPGFSVAFFLRPDRQPEGDEWHTVLYRPLGGRKDARGLGIWLRGTPPRLRAQTFSDREPEYVDTHPLAIGVRQHIAMIADVKRLQIYVDGELHDEIALARPLLPIFGPIQLGHGRDGDSRFHGVIEDLRIYGEPLPASEIRALASA